MTREYSQFWVFFLSLYWSSLFVFDWILQCVYLPIAKIKKSSKSLVDCHLGGLTCCDPWCRRTGWCLTSSKSGFFIDPILLLLLFKLTILDKHLEFICQRNGIWLDYRTPQTKHLFNDEDQFSWSIYETVGLRILLNVMSTKHTYIDRTNVFFEPNAVYFA